MDNEVFRKTYRAINERFCPFEKSILTNNCGCSRGRRFCIAEREGINCGSDAAQARCLELLELLRRQARFALKATDEDAALPHAKAMRVQVGGLRGLHAVAMPDAPIPDTIEDIHGIIEAALDHFHTLAALPYQPIIRQIAAYQGRRRLRRPR
ncbi:hypothetical protein [Candidatus Thiosymbion oneisti]|uniref:hypothetical protein n=1 Tax=Candidatus Thiosymbion oneisti TaxID=589554 RepID=UPI000B7D9C25|nr:hypothetical protein [Candidatus Thiosymbion oneisti]